MDYLYERTRTANSIRHLRDAVAREELKRGGLDINARARLERAIERAKPVYDALSLPVPEPRADEHSFQYRRRVVEDLKHHSPTWAKSSPGRIPDEGGFAIIEREVLAAAEKRGLDPEYAPGGGLRERKVVDASGNESTVFHGSPADAWAPFCGPMKTAVTEFRTPQGRRLYPR
jgi:hypothetical protein